jgi:CRP-like cAMP-binding protein
MIGTESFVQALRGHAFLQDFQDDHVEMLARLATPVAFDADEIIFRLGEVTSYFYLITSGTVTLELAEGAQTIEVARLRRGEELGWSSLLKRTTKHFEARAVTDVQAFAFEGARLKSACEDNPSFGYALMKRLFEVVTGRLEAVRTNVIDTDRMTAKWLCEP